MKPHPFRLVRAAFLVFAFALGTHDALAESGSLTARYALTLAGLPIGTASLSATIHNGSYKITASAKVGGILSLVSDGKGAATSFGTIGPGKPLSGGYALHTRSADKDQTVRMAISGETLGDFAVDPPPALHPDRVPITDADRHGVMDPLSALLMPAAHPRDMLAPSACERTLPIFDGAIRFDVPLSYARTETVEAKGGYSGPALVCSARYVPIAGHRPGKGSAVFMAQNRDLEVWLAPIAGTHVMAPWRIVIGTQVGRLTIDAAQYSSAGAAVQPIDAVSK